MLAERNFDLSDAATRRRVVRRRGTEVRRATCASSRPRGSLGSVDAAIFVGDGALARLPRGRGARAGAIVIDATPVVLRRRRTDRPAGGQCRAHRRARREAHPRVPGTARRRSRGGAGTASARGGRRQARGHDRCSTWPRCMDARRWTRWSQQSVRLLGTRARHRRVPEQIAFNASRSPRVDRRRGIVVRR